MSSDAIGRPFVNPRTPVAEAVLHRGGKHAVDEVFVDGRLVVDGGRVVSIDRDAVMKEIAGHLSAPETSAEAQAWDMVDALVVHLEDFHRRHPLAAAGRPYRFNATADG